MSEFQPPDIEDHRDDDDREQEMAANAREAARIRDEEAFFDVWWALYRVKRWREIRPDMGPEPSQVYMEGLKDTAKLGWLARAGLYVSRSAVNGRC